MNHKSTLFITILVTGALLLMASPALSQGTYAPKELSRESLECIECHKVESAAIYEQWGGSKHFRANIGCYECHAAEKKDKDVFLHDVTLKDGTVKREN